MKNFNIIRLQNCDHEAFHIITEKSFEEKKKELRNNKEWDTYTIMNWGKVSFIKSLFIDKTKLDTPYIVYNY